MVPIPHTGYKNWSHGKTDVSVSEVNMLKNSSTLAVSVPINLSIKLGFVSVNGPREIYFVDSLHIHSKELKFLQVIDESVDCDLTQGFF